jgi:hypothetical protein
LTVKLERDGLVRLLPSVERGGIGDRTEDDVGDAETLPTDGATARLDASFEALPGLQPDAGKAVVVVQLQRVPVAERTT